MMFLLTCDKKPTKSQFSPTHASTKRKITDELNITQGGTKSVKAIRLKSSGQSVSRRMIYGGKDLWIVCYAADKQTNRRTQTSYPCMSTDRVSVDNNFPNRTVRQILRACNIRMDGHRKSKFQANNMLISMLVASKAE